MDEQLEMDLSTRSKDDGLTQDSNGKLRTAKSIFSIRSLVDIGEAIEGLGEPNNGKY